MPKPFKECYSQYQLPNWYIDGKPKIIHCIAPGEHVWHQCDGYRWKTEDEFIGVYLKDVKILESNTHTQVGGDHYSKMAIQPWEVIRRGDLDFFEGNVIKYVMRYRDKNGVEDLEKAMHYLQYLIDREKKNGVV